MILKISQLSELFDTFCSGKLAIKREMTGETEWAVDLCSESGNQYVY